MTDVDTLRRAEHEANAVKTESSARLIHEYLRQRLEKLKEQMIDSGADELRGRAMEVRYLLRQLTQAPTPTEDTVD